MDGILVRWKSKPGVLVTLEERPILFSPENAQKVIR